jgi:hypothetical protein
VREVIHILGAGVERHGAGRRGGQSSDGIGQAGSRKHTTHIDPVVKVEVIGLQEAFYSS